MIETTFPADALDAFQYENSYALACATYQLTEQQDRIGQICLYESNGKDSLVLRHYLNTDAALDCQWRKAVLAAAHAKGHVSLYQLQNWELNTIMEVPIQEQDLVLSLDWLSDTQLVATLNSSQFALLDTNSNTPIHIQSTSLDSTTEVWTCKASIHSPHQFYTGQEDAQLQAWDTRTPEQQWQFKAHEAGVTSITCHPSDCNVLLTGGYDDTIRTWDLRYISHKRNRDLSSFNVGGGIWRMKWLDQRNLVMACMYRGACILQQLENNQWRCVQSFEKHESITYGLTLTGNYIATCSFYDRKICLWSHN